MATGQTIPLGTVGGGVTGEGASLMLWTIIANSRDMVVGEGYVVEGNNVTLLFPPSPAINDVVGVKLGSVFSNLNLQGNGANIENSSDAYSITQRNNAFIFTFLGGTVGWGVTADAKGDSLANIVTQINHGFTIGDILYYDGNLYSKAIAIVEETIGRFVVTQVINANTFAAPSAGIHLVSDPVFAASVEVGHYYMTSNVVIGGVIDMSAVGTESYMIRNPMYQVLSKNASSATIDVLPWRADMGEPVPTYTVEYSAGENGTLTGILFQTISEGSDGTPVEAVPDIDYKFVAWSDGITDNPRMDTNVTGNIIVSAQFATISHFTGGSGDIVSMGDTECPPRSSGVALLGNGQLIIFGYNSNVYNEATKYMLNNSTAQWNNYQTIAQPAEKSGVNIAKFAYSHANLFVIYEDGDLYAMGHNNAGQFGIGNTVPQLALTLVAQDVADVKISSRGYVNVYDIPADFSTIVLKTDGTVWVAGNNTGGKLGLSHSNPVLTLTQVPGIPEIARILPIQRGDAQSYLLDINGELWTAGSNSANFFAKVGGLLTGKVIVDIDICSGSRLPEVVMVLDDQGDVYMWGSNRWGVLGDGSTIDQIVPILTYDGSTDPAIQIGLSKDSYVDRDECTGGILTTSGKLLTAGYNCYGVLGRAAVADNIASPLYTEVDRSLNIKYFKFVSSQQYGMTLLIAIDVNDVMYTSGSTYVNLIGRSTSTVPNNQLGPIAFPGVDQIHAIYNVGAMQNTNEHGWYWWYGVTVVRNDGKRYGWGFNRNGDAFKMLDSSVNYIAEMSVPTLNIPPL